MLRNDEERKSARSKSLGYALAGVVGSDRSFGSGPGGFSKAASNKLSQMPHVNEDVVSTEEDDDENKQTSSRAENFLPKLYNKNNNHLRRKSSVYFAANPKLIPILNNSNPLSTSLDTSTAALNFHRRSSIKLGKYINLRSDAMRLNRIPLRRLSLNVPISTELERNVLPQLNSKRKKSLDSKMPEMPVIRVDESALKFGTMLSSNAQCALLKTYEDEIHSRMRAYLPSKRLPRVTTAKFVSNVKSRRRNITFDKQFNQASRSTSSSSTSSRSFSRTSREESLHGARNDGGAGGSGSSKRLSFASDVRSEREIARGEAKKDEKHKSKNQPKASIRLLKDFRSIEDLNKRVKIADHLQKAMNLVGSLESANAMNVEEVARKYEKWQLQWSKILDECF